MKKMWGRRDNDSVRQILNTEVRFIVGIVVFVFGIVTPYFGIRQDVALIKQDINTINSNHLAHMQDALQEIKEIKVKQEEQDKEIATMQKALIVLLAK